MRFRFLATPQFWRSYRKLTGVQMASALSARFKRTIYSACIDGDLRAVFYQDGRDIVSVDIGTHDIYR
jgi:hypothetical protein